MQNFDLENENGRSLLAESGADAPTVLSAVYTDSTPAKNRQADVPQYGRSMIEMLGVLAIIGVLSVGGIAGYSKAMQKYRINKTIEQITLIAGNIRSFFARQGDYRDVGNATILRKAKLVPDEMWESGKYWPQHVWGGEVHINGYFRARSEWRDNYYIDRAFYIDFRDIPEEACIDLITQDWSIAGFNLIFIWNNENADQNLSSKQLNLLTPVNIETAIRACSTTADDSNGVDTVQFYFNIDVNDSSSGGWKGMIDATNTLLNGS